jgi:hypothetical protein
MYWKSSLAQRVSNVIERRERIMRIAVFGATGTVGKPVADHRPLHRARKRPRAVPSERGSPRRVNQL